MASVGDEVSLWDPENRRLIQQRSLPATAYGITYARYGSSLLISCGDNRIRLWGPSRPEGIKETVGAWGRGFLGVSYGNAGGALVNSVIKESQAEQSGFLPNDIIVGCDDRKFTSSEDFLNFMKDSHEGQEVIVRIKRAGTDKVIKTKLGRWP
jgi:hypothetical protein